MNKEGSSHLREKFIKSKKQMVVKQSISFDDNVSKVVYKMVIDLKKFQKRDIILMVRSNNVNQYA